MYANAIYLLISIYQRNKYKHLDISGSRKGYKPTGMKQSKNRKNKREERKLYNLCICLMFIFIHVW